MTTLTGFDLEALVHSGWPTARFGSIFRESQERNAECPVGVALSVSEYKGVVPRDVSAGQLESEDVSSYRVVRPGQLAANVMWLNRSGLGVSSYTGYVSPAYKVFDIHESIVARFADYLLRSGIYRAAFERLGRGVRPNAQMVDSVDLRALPVPVPSVGLQLAIADFLDRETAKIDALIEKQNALIDRLRERRRSVIDRLLAAPTGAPGTPLRNVVSIQSGVTLGKTYENANLRGYPYVRVANVQVGAVDTTDLLTIELPHAVASRSMLRAGDVLITEGGDRAALARGSLWAGEVEPCLHQNHIYALRCDPRFLRAEYLLYVLEGSGARQYFEMTRRQTTNLSATNSRLVRAFRFTLPSLQEQEHIVTRLDAQISAIDALISKAERFVELARERRSALITAAVTGQIDVGQ